MAVSLDSWVQNIKRCTESIEEDSPLSDYISTVQAVVKSHQEVNLTELQKSLDDLHAQRRVASQIQDQIASLKTKQDEITKEIEKIHTPTDKDKCIMRLRALFKETTGLEFKVTDDGSSVSMIFTKIDPATPSREWTVTLDVQEDTRQWKLIGVSPHIEGVLALLEQLNKDNDLHQFARNIRTLFKRTLNRSQ